MLIILQKETGSALVYCGFIFMLYREGLSGWYIAAAGLAILIFILTLTTSSYFAIFGLYFLLIIYLGLKDGRWILLLSAGIPAIDIIAFDPTSGTGFHPTWHTANDNLANIDPQVLAAVGQVLLNYIYAR